MLLRHSANLETEAAAIEQAVAAVLEAGHRTPDIARNTTSITTSQMGKLVLQHLKLR